MERAKTAGILRLVAGIIICLGLVFTNFAQGYPETTDPDSQSLSE